MNLPFLWMEVAVFTFYFPGQLVAANFSIFQKGLRILKKVNGIG